MHRKYIIIGQYSEPGFAGQMRFSKTEVIHIAISMLVLILAFALFFMGGIFGIGKSNYMTLFMVYLVIAAVGVSTEFLLHELAHKFMAQKYGCWSEYRYTEQGLMITLISGLLGFLIAAPGVVWHSGHITEKQEGKISAAGPMVNIGLGALFTAFAYLLPHTSLLWLLVFLVGMINVWVGGFNLIPLPPLDGSKIHKWSIPIYILMWAAVICLGYVLFFIIEPGWLF